ncbi:hypothetical protein [Burkholderia guangdongensis]|uniref:hypothetical protein n=1 Tax=Burkholderia guangdongensis TaxID=1792500 RepID=UPI0015C6DD80|nr:hypothetical protein [Burkholderia guangdongensis]
MMGFTITFGKNKLDDELQALKKECDTLKQQNKKLEDEKANVSHAASNFTKAFIEHSRALSQEIRNSSLYGFLGISIIMPNIYETTFTIKGADALVEFVDFVNQYNPYYVVSHRGGTNELGVYCETTDENLAMMLKLKYC